MTRKNNYNYQYPVGDQKIIKKLSDPKYEGGNIALPKEADETEKIKYTIGQSILNYHLETKKSLTVIAEEIALADITEKKVYDICRGKISNFSLGELIVSALNLRIYSIPCLDCGGDIMPILLGDVVYSLKKQENLPTKIPNIYQALAKHQSLVHCQKY